MRDTEERIRDVGTQIAGTCFSSPFSSKWMFVAMFPARIFADDVFLGRLALRWHAMVCWCTVHLPSVSTSGDANPFRLGVHLPSFEG